MLTIEQAAFVESTEPRTVLLAGPGTGKTHTLSYRINWLLQEHGLSPIAVLTFTNRAARELRSRIAQSRSVITPEFRDLVYVGTFHAYCISVMRHYPDLRFEYGLSNEFVASPRPGGKDEEAIMGHPLGMPLRQLVTRMGTKETLTKAAQRLNEDPEFERIWHQNLVSMDMADYELVMKVTQSIFLDHPERIPSHIILDEGQDVGAGVRWIVERIAPHVKTISVVGDDWQSIYSFLGGYRGWIVHDLKNQGYKYRYLTENFRCGSRILDTLNRLMEGADKTRPEAIAKRDLEGRVSFCCSDTLEQESERLVENIRDQLDRGAVRSKIAVLARTHSRYRVAREALKRAGIPVQAPDEMYEAMETPVFATIVSVLRWIQSPENDHLFEQAALRLGAEPGQLTLLRSDKAFKATGSLFRAVLASATEWHEKRPFKFLLGFRKGFENGGLYWLLGGISGLAESQWIRDQFLRLFDTYRLYSSEDWEAMDRDRISEFLQFLNDCRTQDLLTATGEDAGVTVTTVHSAKGLEFTHVHFLGFEEGEMPKGRADSELEEECRVCFVGMSRASHELTLYRVRNKPKYPGAPFSEPVAASPFWIQVNGGIDR